MSDKCRVLIAGAGALGSVFGGFLRLAGHEVTLLGRDSHMKAIADAALIIEGIWGDHTISHLRTATDAASLRGASNRGPFDAILISVKSFDTATIATNVADLLSPTGIAISLQNGLGNVETLEPIFGAARTLGARVIFGAEITEPGKVHVSVIADPNAIGSLDAKAFAQREEAAKLWAQRFENAGLPSIYTDQLPSRLWAKVLYNAALNPLGALIGVHYGALSELADSRAIMDAVIDEAFAVATIEGAELPWRNANDYRSEFYNRLVPATYHHRPSMLQDLEAGRRTEIEAINGEVVRRGKLCGIPTPVNETLMRIVRLRQ